MILKLVLFLVGIQLNATPMLLSNGEIIDSTIFGDISGRLEKLRMQDYLTYNHLIDVVASKGMKKLSPRALTLCKHYGVVGVNGACDPVILSIFKGTPKILDGYEAGSLHPILKKFVQKKLIKLDRVTKNKLISFAEGNLKQESFTETEFKALKKNGFIDEKNSIRDYVRSVILSLMIEALYDAGCY